MHVYKSGLHPPPLRIIMSFEARSGRIGGLEESCASIERLRGFRFLAQLVVGIDDHARKDGQRYIDM